MTLTQERIAIVPDRFAAYRKPIMEAIGQRRPYGLKLSIFADTKERAGIPIAKRECLSVRDLEWVPIKEFYLSKWCIWQSRIIGLPLRRKYLIIIYWGEVHKVSTWISAIFAKLTGVKVMFWTHGLYGREGFLKRLVRLRFYRLADAILLYGEHSKKLLVTAGFNESCLFVINNSLDTSAQKAITCTLTDSNLSELRSQFTADREHLLCFVGRLEPRKQLDMLLQAVSNLNEKEEVTKLLLIGDGSEKEKLRQLSNELCIDDRVYFYGACYDDEKVIPLIQMSDMLVSPGDVGLSAIHALQCGVPVVTHSDLRYQVPEMEAIIPDVTGQLFERGSVSDLVEKILDCLNNLRSEKITREYCRAVIRDRYSVSYQLSVFESALSYALTSSLKSGPL